MNPLNVYFPHRLLFLKHIRLQHRIFLAFAGALLLISGPALAGTVTLTNGESLKGDIDVIHRDSVQWATEAIGVITIPKDAITNISTESKMKVYGVDDTCFWQGINDGDVMLICGEDTIVYRSFKSLNNVVREANQHVNGYQFNGNILGVGTSSSGNKNEENWLLDIYTVLRHSDYRHISSAKYETESVEENQDLEEMKVSYALDWFFSRKIYLFVSSTAGRDDTREFDARYTFGTGLGYQFWDNTQSALSLQTGGEYIREEPSDALFENEEYESWQISTSYRTTFFRDLKYYFRASTTHSLRDSDEWNSEVETGLSMPLVMGVTADIKYEYDYDNMPLDALEKADSSFRVGFGYAW